MRKADVIAKCLVHSSLPVDLKAGRQAVRAAFENSVTDKSFSKWNSVVEEKVANSIIRSVGKPKAINIEKFIADLVDDPALVGPSHRLASATADHLPQGPFRMRKKMGRRAHPTAQTVEI